MPRVRTRGPVWRFHVAFGDSLQEMLLFHPASLLADRDVRRTRVTFVPLGQTVRFSGKPPNTARWRRGIPAIPPSDGILGQIDASDRAIESSPRVPSRSIIRSSRTCD